MPGPTFFNVRLDPADTGDPTSDLQTALNTSNTKLKDGHSYAINGSVFYQEGFSNSIKVLKAATDEEILNGTPADEDIDTLFTDASDIDGLDPDDEGEAARIASYQANNTAFKATATALETLIGSEDGETVTDRTQIRRDLRAFKLTADEIIRADAQDLGETGPAPAVLVLHPTFAPPPRTLRVDRFNGLTDLFEALKTHLFTLPNVLMKTYLVGQLIPLQRRCEQVILDSGQV